MEGLQQEEKEKYEAIAVALFSKKPPGSQKKATLNCPGKTCDAKISEQYSLLISICIATQTVLNVEATSVHAWQADKVFLKKSIIHAELASINPLNESQNI